MCGTASLRGRPPSLDRFDEFENEPKNLVELFGVKLVAGLLDHLEPRLG